MAKYVLIIILVIAFVAALVYVNFSGGGISSGNLVGERELSVVQSKYSAEQTIRRIKGILAKKQIPIFAQINHSEAAKKVNLPLKKTVVIIFGSPKVGTLLMQKNRKVAAVLPLKILVWEDDNGKVWLGYVRPELIAQRYNLKGNKILENMAKLLKEICVSAAGKN